MRARNNEDGETVKIASKALHCLTGDFDNFSSNQRLNANNKTRGPHLQAANMASLMKMADLANMVNLANVANSPTSPATFKSMQMTSQMKKHINCEFQQQKLTLFALLYSYLSHSNKCA